VEETGFKLWYIGNMSIKNGVGIVLDKSIKDGVVDIKRQEDMIILVKLLVGDLIFNIISDYAPQIGLNESVKMQFWEELDALVSSVTISEKLFIGDLNGHVSSIRVGFDGVHGGFAYESRNQEGKGILELDALVSSVTISEKLFIGDLNGHVSSIRVGFNGVHRGFAYESRNQEGKGILNFALAYDLIVANTLFRKRFSHLVTFNSGQHCNQIDFILAKREDRHTCLDCKVIPGECVVPQQKLVVTDFCFRVRCEARGSVGALLSRKTESEATGHVTMPEPSQATGHVTAREPFRVER
jgi:hypothetical protein